MRLKSSKNESRFKVFRLYIFLLKLFKYFQPPQYELLPPDTNDYGARPDSAAGNNMTRADIIKIIDSILW